MRVYNLRLFINQVTKDINTYSILEPYCGVINSPRPDQVPSRTIERMPYIEEVPLGSSRLPKECRVMLMSLFISLHYLLSQVRTMKIYRCLVSLLSLINFKWIDTKCWDRRGLVENSLSFKLSCKYLIKYFHQLSLV